MSNKSQRNNDSNSASSQDHRPNTSSQPPQAPTTNPPAMPQSARRIRGRPLGSKNKRSSTSVPVARTPDSPMNVFTFNVAQNADIMEAILNIAHRDHVSVTVMNVSGTIHNLALQSSTENAPPIILHGPFTLISLSGSYLYNNNYNLHPGASPPLPPSFGIHFSTSQGQLFSGIIAGRVIAGHDVMITVSTFTNPDILKYTPEDNEEDDNNNNSPSDFSGGGGGISGFNPVTSGIRG